MFSSTRNRFLSTSYRLLTKFKVYPDETPIRHRALVEAIAESKDQSAYFAWHPKKDVPYEFTRPLPTALEQKNQSLLKETLIDDAKSVYSVCNRPKFVEENLAKMTYTSKHRWFPRARDKKAKKNPMDRPFL